MVVLTEREGTTAQQYSIEYRRGNKWIHILDEGESSASRVKIHRFPAVWGDAVRVSFKSSTKPVSIAEFGVYNERL